MKTNTKLKLTRIEDTPPPTFVSDAERQRLPLVNEHDVHNAPLLDVTATIRRSERRADNEVK